jgi:hypothetical protein
LWSTIYCLENCHVGTSTCVFSTRIASLARSKPSGSGNTHELMRPTQLAAHHSLSLSRPHSPFEIPCMPPPQPRRSPPHPIPYAPPPPAAIRPGSKGVQDDTPPPATMQEPWPSLLARGHRCLPMAAPPLLSAHRLPMAGR